MNIIKVDTVSSTNTRLKELSSDQELQEGTVLITQNQTAGRGQTGNLWESEPYKNLTFSIVLYPVHIPAGMSFLISQLISLGIVDTIDEYVTTACIKWPNDIYYGEKKLAGMLIENDITAGLFQRSIIGIGLNVNQEIFRSSAPNPISLVQIIGKTLDIGMLLEKMHSRIMARYSASREGIFSGLADEYKATLYWGTGFHRFRDCTGEFTAKVKHIADNGLLSLQLASGEIRQYAFKEVAFLNKF